MPVFHVSSFEGTDTSIFEDVSPSDWAGEGRLYEPRSAKR